MQKKVDPNPQGKGLSLISVMSSTGLALNHVPAKNVLQVANELFTSMFILSADFSFRPVIGREYWLYFQSSGFKLSLIAPDEWHDQSFGQVVGCCQLQSDMTWSLNLSQSAQANVFLMQHIERQRLAFEQQLGEQQSLAKAMPVYEAKLPFYQRLYATMLSKSLHHSMLQSSIAQLDYQSALDLENDHVQTQ